MNETSWAAVDLGPTLSGDPPPSPSVFRRDDGHALLYPGRTHWFQGEAETCKSWAALLGVREVLQADRRALWIDYEDDARGVVERLRALGVTDDKVKQWFTYVRPEEALSGSSAAMRDFGILCEHDYAIAVVDGVTEAMVTEALDPMSNTDTARFMRRLPRELTHTGAAVVCLDHVARNAEMQRRGAIGAQHKLAGLTGVSYRLDMIAPFYRPRGSEPVEGQVRFTVHKDRLGHVRSIADDDVIGVLRLTALANGTVTGVLVAEGRAPRPAPPQGLVAEILGWLVLYDGSSGRNITEHVLGKAETIREALAWLASHEPPLVTIEPVGNAHRHHVTETGRAWLQERKP
jgi:hypothetical protein